VVSSQQLAQGVLSPDQSPSLQIHGFDKSYLSPRGALAKILPDQTLSVGQKPVPSYARTRGCWEHCARRMPSQSLRRLRIDRDPLASKLFGFRSGDSVNAGKRLDALTSA
jgi:hypothetical protein